MSTVDISYFSAVANHTNIEKHSWKVFVTASVISAIAIPIFFLICESNHFHIDKKDAGGNQFTACVLKNEKMIYTFSVLSFLAVFSASFSLTIYASSRAIRYLKG